MTFTDDFTVSAWVKLSSYANATIVSRYNGTSGWRLEATSSGQVYLAGYNAGSANTSYVISYQSLPLNKWVHITAQLDMSAFTATSTTSYVMFDGVDVPVSVARGGTNPTALVQAGNLEVGSFNSGSNPFPGKIAQAAVFSAKVTQATMRGYISQGLTGSETSLVSAFSFNNSSNDLNTTNANNLTASGAATATNADSPFGGQADGTISSTLDYGILQKITATTATVQAAEGCTIPTDGAISSVSYANVKSPYGFPGEKGKWSLVSLIRTQTAFSTTVASFAYTNYALTVPTGAWVLGYRLGYFINGTGVNAGVATTLSSSSASVALASEEDINMTSRVQLQVSGVPNFANVSLAKDLTVSSATPYYLMVLRDNVNNTLNIDGDNTPNYIYAENAYL